MVAWKQSKQKEVVTIDLKHAAAVVDLNPDLANMSPASKMTRMTSWDMDDEGYGVARPNSFRVDFDDGEAITFSADNKAEKARWYVSLSQLAKFTDGQGMREVQKSTDKIGWKRSKVSSARFLAIHSGQRYLPLVSENRGSIRNGSRCAQPAGRQ